MTIQLVYIINRNTTARCVSLFQGSQMEIIYSAKAIVLCNLTKVDRFLLFTKRESATMFFCILILCKPIFLKSLREIVP